MFPLGRPLFVVLTVACTVQVHCARPERRAPADVLLISIDTLRADHLGAYGYEKARTPAFDALAAQGVRFEVAITPIPRTTPAVATMLSGRLPAEHGSREVGQAISSDVPLLTEILAARGFQTAAVSANVVAGPKQGLARGFSRFVDTDELKRVRARNVTDSALRLTSSFRLDAPLFLWVHYLDPHFPYHPPPPWLAAKRAAACDAAANFARDELRLGQLFANVGGRAETARTSCLEGYDAEIAYTDAQVTRLLAGVGRIRGGFDRLVIVTSDHGENFGEDDLYFEHGPSLHDASVRIPLVFHGPGIRPRVADEIARLQDVAPTVLNWLGIPVRELPRFDGIDLFAASARETEPGTEERTAFVESASALQIQSPRYISGGTASGWHCTHGPRFSLCEGAGRPLQLFEPSVDPDFVHDLSRLHPAEVAALRSASRRWPPETPRSRGVRGRRFKLIEAPKLEGSYERRLYDLGADRDEVHDVAAEQRREVVRLGRLLDDWTRRLPPPKPLDLSDEELAELRALGYLN